MAGKFDAYKTALPQILQDSKTQLEAKNVEVPEDFKLKDLPTLIAKVEVGSKVEIVVTAPDYEGQTLTAKKDPKELTAQVKSGTCRFEVDEAGIWTISAQDERNIEVEVKFQFEGNFAPHAIYGITIDESESDPTLRVSYRDDAVGMIPIKVNFKDGTVNYNGWDKKWILKKIYPVMLKTDGTIDYKLDPFDQTKRADNGEPSDIANLDYDGNAMVCVERFYTKFSMNGEDEVIQVSDTPQDGFEPIGFVREDGSIADRFFMPMFGGYRHNNKLRSIAGLPISSITYYDANVEAAEANGPGYGIGSYAMNQVISVLITILIKSCNCTEKLGEGRFFTRSTSGITKYGPFSYEPYTKAVKAFWIEDFITSAEGGVFWYESGFIAFNGKIYIKMSPPYSSQSTENYMEVLDFSYPPTTEKSYVSKMKCSNQTGRIAVEYSGTNKNYECSYWRFYSGVANYLYIFSKPRGSIWGFESIVPTTNGQFFSAYLTYLPPAEVVYE